MTTLNKTLEELKFEFSDMTGFLQDAFSTGEESLTSIKNNLNRTNRRLRLAKFQNITGPNGIDGMTTKFSEAQNVLMKKTSSEIAANTAVAPSKLEVYDNTLPFGIPAAGGVNEQLRDVKEKTWDNFSNFYGKIFRKVGKAEFEEMIRNTSHLSQSDVKNMIYSTCGSLSEWPQINPKSAGMGRCSTLFQIFNKHYMGYTAGGTGLKVSDFYHDLISSLHTAEVYGLSGKNKPTTITGFSNKIETYNINTELWFLSDKDKEDARYNGFARTGEDSYGNFFDIGGFPYKLNQYNTLNTAIDANGNLPVNTYIQIETRLKTILKKNNGAYIQLYPNTAATPNTTYGNGNNILVKSDLKIDDNTGNPKSISKKICSLFLNEGQTADINKLEKIEYPIRYLFNTQEMYGISPYTDFIPVNEIFDVAAFGASELPAVDPRLATYITRINPFKNIFCYNQKIPEIGVLLFVRKIFQELYPVQDANPAHATNDIINIFKRHQNIVRTIAAVNGHSLNTTYGPAGAPTVYTNVYVNDTADIVSKKLLKVIEAYSVDWPTLRPEYYKKFIEPLMKLIRESPTKYQQQVNGTYTRDYYVRDFRNADFSQIVTQPLLNMTFPNMPVPPQVINHATIAAFFNNVPDSLTAPIGAAAANNAVSCVLMYRYIMYALIFKYVSEMDSNQAGNNRNKYNLYDDDGVNNTPRILTLTEPVAMFNDLSRFKQLIPDVNPVMKGGKSKSINKIKTGGNKKIQKGGARQTLFVDTPAAGNQGAPRLYANRRLQEFNPALFKNAVKKYKELNFNSDYATVKALFNKISHCSYLPLFFDHFENDVLNITQIQAGTGGCGVAAPAAAIPLSFSDIAQLFLFNCVNTTTTTLLIHFFKNIKACLNHFVATDLKTVETNFGKNIVNQQSAKIEGSFRELNKELDKLINFLKYNTLNLQEQTINLNDNGGPLGGVANPLFVYNANEHYIKNLFLGANVYFSYLPNANQFVVMRLTDSDLGDPVGGAGAADWQGTNFFKLLNRIVGCTESADDFTKTIQFLTDNRNDANEYGLQTYLATLTGINPLVNNRYLQKIRPHIKDKPDGCFGGIPFVSLDPKIYKLLMLSYYFLLKLRLVVGEESKKDQQIVEEEIFSELSIDKQREIIDTIKSKLSASAFSALASSLTSSATLKQADLLFESFYLFLFNESNRLIEEVKKAEQLTKESSKNKSKKSNLFSIKGGQSTSIYSLRPKTNSNNGNLLKKQIDFIKTKYQASSKFDFIIKTLTNQLKKQIELKRVRNNLQFFYYIDTHFRNFKIYMDTLLFTIGEKNIPPEVSQKLQQYVKYSPDKSKYKESFTSLKNSPLVDPQYSDPLWWAKIERKFTSIQKQTNVSDDVVYRLFIITTTPTSGLKKLSLRDIYIVDAFNLATLNDDRSKIDQPSWFSTGYRTHAGIKSVEIAQKNSQGHNQFVYSDSNTVIKLTGITIHDSKNRGINSVAFQKKLKNLYNKLPRTTVRTENNKLTQAVHDAIHPDIRKLINGEYLYYDKHDNKYKKLIPLFLQGSTNLELNNILTHQQQLKYRPFKQKFSDTVDYKIYQMEDEKIQNLKEFRKWLYLIFMEQQMSLAKKDDDLFTTKIQKTMKQAFNNFLGSDMTGKCARVYNIYDLLNGITLNPQPINPVRIKCSDFDNFDLGSVMIEGFISRESLIKLMLLY